MRRLLAILFLLALPLHAALPPNVEKLETFGGITQYRLKSNDMTILLAPNHASPVFTFMVVYHVGSRNEAPGNTGSAHLLEHMIFNKSTENFGRAKGHKTFQEVLYEAGADFSSTNMTTWYDRMNGYSTLPSDKLELAMKIEADRLGRGLILESERLTEMSVVRNEYEIGENNPQNALYKSVLGAAIQAHPYHWDTIGYRSDIEGVTTEKLREHYKNFFFPNNAEAILVGDFDAEKALAIFDREFGGFKKSTQPIPQVITVEPPQEGERRTTVRRPGQLSMVALAYMRPGMLHADYIPLDVLTNILGEGVNARLYQALIETGLATDLNAINFALRDPFPLYFDATAAPGKTHDELEKALKAALYEIAEKGVTDEEVKRAQQQIEVAVIRGRDGTFPFARDLGEAVASANWKWFVSYLDNLRAVTAADVHRVAKTYLVPHHATVGWYVPGTSGAPAGRQRAAGTFAQRTTRKVLANGIIVDVVENHAVPTVAIRGLILGGTTSAPPGKPAVPDLTAMMLERGTTSRNKEQIAALLEGAGATRDYSTTQFETQLVLNGMARDLPMLIDVLSDELRNPAFPADELPKAKAELKTNVARDSENTGQRAIARLSQLVYPQDHPYRHAGHDALAKNAEATTLDDLRAYYKQRYVGAATIIAIVGDVDATKAIAAVEKALGSLPKGSRTRVTRDVTTPNAPLAEVVTMRGKANMNILMGFASGLRRLDSDYEAALIGNAALGQTSLSSRIGRRVRDTEGLSYTLGSRYQMSDDLDGIWYVNVNVAPQNLAKAMKSTREEIEKFAREGVTDDEIAIQKSFFAGNYQVGLGTNAGVASALVTAEKLGFGPRYLDEFPARIRAVTKDQVNAAMKKHFTAGKMHVVVAGDLEKLPE